jgi:hypothetical protein
MSGTLGNYRSDVSNVVNLEQQLALTLSIAAKAVDHMDCFDAEQRSEIYTILQALRQDTAAHCTLVGQWVRDRKDPLYEPRPDFAKASPGKPSVSGQAGSGNA